MIRITPSTFSRLQEWHDAAVATPSVWRFMATSKFIDQPRPEDYASDWSRIAFISDSGLTVLRAVIDRETDDYSIGLWSLADGMRKRVEVGRACVMLRNVVLPAYGARTISTVVHATNEASLRIMGRIFGEPWGIEPLAGWDRGSGRMVDVHHFRRAVSALSALPCRASIYSPPQETP
jgi:hypothetical protein